MRTAVRTSFESDLKINWFPGHMSKTLNELAAQRLKQAHVVVEVRDARIPFSSANRRLDKMLEANKPRFVVLNKCDLAGLESSSRLARDLVKEIKRRSRCTDVVFTHATCDQQGGSGVGFLLKRVASNLPGRFKTTPKTILVAGVPNTGKSTIINAMRSVSKSSGSGPGTASIPGYTKQFAAFRVVQNPPVFVMDSPGVLVPSFEMNDSHSGLKLALCGAVKQEVVDADILSDFLLYTLNTKGISKYTKFMKVPEESDDILHVLTEIEAYISGRRSKGEISLHNAAHFFLRKFRQGALGHFVLDEVPIFYASGSLFQEDKD